MCSGAYCEHYPSSIYQDWLALLYTDTPGRLNIRARSNAQPFSGRVAVRTALAQRWFVPPATARVSKYVWSYDFVADRIPGDRKFRMVNISTTSRASA